MVKSDQIYSPENYVCGVTGNYYFFKNKMHPVDEIHYLLDPDYEIWDYPLTEIDHIVENDLDVVLVDCSHYEEGEYVSEYRWFEVFDDFEEEYDEEE
jgi:hypothetical protein